MGKVGILGGTFDPPHIGHLIMAEEVRVALQLDEIWFIPSYEPPHKQKAHSSRNDRLYMLEKSIQDNEYFHINSIELKRKGKSYTIDTVKALNKQYPNDKFYFIIGADMVEYLPNWKNIDELMGLITFVGVTRPGYKLKTSYPVKMIDIPMIHLSSTEIRDRVANGKSIKYLVQHPVEQFIEGKGLYEYRSSN